MANRRELAETAALLRRVLELVDAGVLEANSSLGRAMVRRIEGAATALETAAT